MLLKGPPDRPAMQAVQLHPLWWSSEQRLQFLVDISDRCVGWPPSPTTHQRREGSRPGVLRCSQVCAPITPLLPPLTVLGVM